MDGLKTIWQDGFWNEYHRRELLHTLRARWKGFSKVRKQKVGEGSPLLVEIKPIADRQEAMALVDHGDQVPHISEPAFAFGIKGNAFTNPLVERRAAVGRIAKVALAFAISS